MRIQVVESTVGQSGDHQFAISYLINDTLAVDAGCIGFLHPLSRQQQIRNVLLTHSHADHIASLPMFLENVYVPKADPVTIYASSATQITLQAHLFNDEIWPDLLRIGMSESSFFEWQTLTALETISVDGLQITPLPLDHLVPTFGFLIDDGVSSLAIISDTGPTDHVWEFLNKEPRLNAVFLEVSFPESMQEVASRTKHLTPSAFLRERQKLQRDVEWYCVHVKAALHAEILSDLESLADSPVIPARSGAEYSF